MTEFVLLRCENRNRDLWSEVRRIKGRNKFLPSSIDGVVGDEEMAQLFSAKHNHLYNSVSYDVDEMNVINTEINKQIKENVAYDITVDEVIEGVQRLKLGKSDGEEGLNSNHIIHGPKILFVLLALIFNSMLVHGFSPNSMLVGSMVPIPKDKRQLVCISAALLPNCLMLLYYLRNKMLLQHRICNLVLNKICPLLTAHML